jgi:hypothetical protein
MVTLGVVLSLGCGSHLLADSTIATAKEKTMKGVATRIDPAGKTVWVKGFWRTKRLNVADDCKVVLPDRIDARLGDLRPGQKLEINYENAQGVLVAHQIAQQNVTFTGVVRAIDPARRTLTLGHHALDKTFQIADDCKVLLRDERPGTLTDVRPAHRVTVTYEIPNHTPTAHQIAQTSATYSGTLSAIDLAERTLKAKALVGEKRFNLAGDCLVVIGGKPGARLTDLKLDEELVLSYDDVDGVNVVNRIATGEATSELPTTASVQPHRSEMPFRPQ